MTRTRELLDRLGAEHGEAFYLLDTARFTDNLRSFRQAFRQHYPRTEIAYSYKTNYLPPLCRAVDRLDGYAEVVSELEYDLARRVGVAAERIVFNGPYKPAAILERALHDGATVNLDGAAELAAVEDLASRRPGRPLSLGLRCNLDVGTGEVSRFGFDGDTDDLERAARRLEALDGYRPAGLHCHVCTADKSVKLYERIADAMIALTRRVFVNGPPRSINLGGGFFSPMPESLRRQFACPVPGYAEYAEAIAPRLAAAFSGEDAPQLILEPGIGVCADALRFATRVVEVKQLRGRTVAVVAGSVYNIKPTKSPINLPASLHPTGHPDARRAAAPLDVVGYTCMEDDLLLRDHPDALAPGDWLVFGNVGAYSIVLKPPFIFPCPPVLELDPQGNVAIVKRAERFEDLFATFPLED